jgi:hypothetical protein
MENQTTNPTLINDTVKHGGILGIITIALTLVVYAIDYALLVDWKFGIFSFAIFLGYGIYAGIAYRKEVGGFLSFGKAFQHGFLVFAISALISTVFNILLYTVVDPELPAKVTEVTIENTEKMMEGFGMSGDAMDEAMAKTRKDTEERYTAVGLAKGYIWILIGCAVFALITGAIVKKKQPEAI